MGISSFEFRTATANDAAGVAQVLDVFGAGYGAAHEQLIHAHPYQWRVGLDGNEIVCALRAAPSELWVGTSRLKSADIGEVAVARARQGQGLGGRAMADCNGWLRESGYAVARLGGLMRFYSRFGYEPFPRCYVEFPISDAIRAGAARIAFAELLIPALASAGCIRAYEVPDFKDLCGLIDGFTRGQTGSRVFHPAAQSPEHYSEWLVYEDSQARIRGAMRCSQYEKDVTPFESMVMISGIAYEVGNSTALEALLKHALRMAHERGARRMTAYLPHRKEVSDDLQRTGLDFTLCTHCGGVAGNMVRVVNLARCLHSLRPELEKRLSGNPASATLQFSVGDGVVGVRVDGARLTIEEQTPQEPASGETVRFTHGEFMATLLGLAPHGRIVSREIQVLLDRMFPAHRGSYISTLR